MDFTEEGYITGSIDVSRLDEVEATSDEAKAQRAALKREFGIDQPESDAEGAPKPYVDGPKKPAPETGGDDDQGDEEEDLDALRAEAEAAGVKVDRRWGADRLREETAAVRGNG